MVQGYKNIERWERDVAYNELYIAFMNQNREAIIICCKRCEILGISQFHEKASAEMNKIYSDAGIKTVTILSSLEYLPDNVLMVYAQACMNVIFNENMQILKDGCKHSYYTFPQPKQYQYEDVLFSQGNNQLTVRNVLKVLKYAISIAEIIRPDDKRISYASSSILALQSIFDLFTNSSKTVLTNHTLHIATDFLKSNVKESLTDINAQRNVAISSLMVDLTIDYLVRD